MAEKNKIILLTSFPESIWKPLKGFEIEFLIANCGCIYSILNERIIPVSIVNGYYKVRIRKDGYLKHFRVNRLVAIHFVKNPRPDIFDIVNHLDLNKMNNYYTNLEWTDHVGNIRHYYNSKTYGKRPCNTLVLE